MSLLTDDLTAIFADTSLTVSVEFAASVVQGFISSQDVPENDGAGGVTIVSRRIVRVQEGALTGLAEDSPITVDGVSYTIHGVRSGGRGKTIILLA